ncbi:EamA family transporter RarD [Vibrio sp. SCSIO 43137]|uniref:EamA family transporter RarD n=1 Tax=Vibrio sp. SCSIO 43137 TaxID=3021011 RepID=UPI002306F045|nr:EamA family transporter RarD [Vibrio sp. SCSIO 43137]WCE28316.1 EamA family transporter RarD [Vibrio sp. SCSIO 43137]
MSGNLLSVSAFFLWGLIPLYFQFLPDANVLELLSIRILVSIPIMLLLIKLLSGSVRTIYQALENKRVLLLCMLAGVVNTVSLYSMTWALTNNEVLAVSMGYFINPIISIVLGVMFFKDNLTPAQKAAVVFSCCGIAYQVFYYGELPWLSLVMGGAFALYGLIKKYIPLDPMTTTLFELISLMPAAMMVILWGVNHSDSILLSPETSEILLYLGAAPVTLIPLVLFAMAVERTTLTMIGLIQYIEPSLQFILAVLVFGELFDMAKFISFSCIWLGLFLVSVEALSRKRAKKFSRATE